MSYATSVIKSIQYGTVTLTGVASATATITAVNTAKAVLIHLGTSYDNTINLDRALTRITLTNSTTVTGVKNTTTGVTITSFVVVEFY
jgi:hypothetical protein